MPITLGACRGLGERDTGLGCDRLAVAGKCLLQPSSLTLDNMRIDWATQSAHEEAAISMLGIVSARLVVARDGSWMVMSHGGRVTGGKALSVGHAKQAALSGLRDTLESCLRELEAAQKLA